MNYYVLKLLRLKVDDERKVSLRQSGYLVHMVLTGYKIAQEIMEK